MEAFGIIGLFFGMSAMALVTNLKKEVSDLKEELTKTGVLKENSGNN
ncbi:MAG: hypothetical protein H8E72_09535 [Candidatus Marinimicrobia bacterium]|nr:hypothetical protein [Candidatus Neomarinimicrobiota bacterium]